MLPESGLPGPRRQRAHGRIALAIERMGERSGLRRLAESGSSRLRLPRNGGRGPPEAVILNTAGGVAGGDRFDVAIDLGPGSKLVATTAAAERIYRSDGTLATIATRLTLAAGAHLAWLPQETILFDAARLARRLDVDLDPGAAALLYEATAFGRAASAERVRDGVYEDRWRVRRGGRLVYADTLRLAGPISDLLDRPPVAAGGRALATLLYVAHDAEARLEEARERLAGAASECGASAWNGCLAVRWIAPAIEPLRADAARFITAFRGAPMPRVWSL